MDYLDQTGYHLIAIDEDTAGLAEKFIDFGILKQKSFDDCQYIALAILAGSVCKKGEFHNRLKEYGMAIVDACHHAASQ